MNPHRRLVINWKIAIPVVLITVAAAIWLVATDHPEPPTPPTPMTIGCANAAQYRDAANKDQDLAEANTDLQVKLKIRSRAGYEWAVSHVAQLLCRNPQVSESVQTRIHDGQGLAQRAAVETIKLEAAELWDKAAFELMLTADELEGWLK